VKVCLIDVHPYCDRSAREVPLLLEAGVEVLLVSPARDGGGRPVDIPPGCEWQALFGGVKGLLTLRQQLRQSQADCVHSHCRPAAMAAAYLLARSAGLPFHRDFNETIIHEAAKEPPTGPLDINLFENASHWERRHHSDEEARIAATVELVPASVDSLLDVGCGDGRITNRLTNRIRRVVGVDASAAALSYVDGETHQGPVDQLDFPDDSFDLVSCLEVIEHLPGSAFEACLAEIERVARRYALISVPLLETLAVKNLPCAICGHRFNQTGHLRRFSKRDLGSLLRTMRVVELRECGAAQRHYYNRGLLMIRQRIAGVYNRSPNAICPECGTNLFPTNVHERNSISDACDVRNKKLRNRLPMTQSHCLALFEHR
jgi:SAM-dependent methyltransferase